MIQEDPWETVEARQADEGVKAHAAKVAAEKERVATANRSLSTGMPVYEEKRTSNGKVLERRGLDQLGIKATGIHSETATDKLLTERGKTHGAFHENAQLSQSFKAAIHHSQRQPGAQALTPSMQEALDMICSKMSRILTGNSFEPDHWADIAGYARLVEKQLNAHKE